VGNNIIIIFITSVFLVKNHRHTFYSRESQEQFYNLNGIFLVNASEL